MQTAAGRMEHMVDFYGLVDIDVLDRMILQQLAGHGTGGSDDGSDRGS
jgi:hypothetical protein